VTAAGAVSALPSSGGPILGILEDESFSESEMRLAPGDTLVLFTDGITEATNEQEELYGDDRLKAALETREQLPRAKSVVERIAADVRQFVSNAPQSDDLTMLVVRYRGHVEVHHQ
jgi:sigma-B regulation protein RsbU (phosphoserine phosphatase)